MGVNFSSIALMATLLLASSQVYSERSSLLSADSSVLLKDRDKETGLKNPQMLKDYLEDTGVYYSLGEHILLSMFMGGLTGGIMGGMIGFYGYESDTQPTSARFMNVYLLTGIIAGSGLLIGGVVAIVEHFNGIPQFEVGKDLMKYTIYSTLLGAVVGSLAGLIPYSSNGGDIDSILNYTGYGSAAGLGLGLIFYLLFEVFLVTDQSEFNLYYDPLGSKFNIAFSREISF